jgi:thiamine biosynthesis protein ThiS
MGLRFVYRPFHGLGAGPGQAFTTPWLTLTYADFEQYAEFLTIILNGERYELDEPISVAGLLARLEIDPRRVAIEHNLEIIKRQTFSDVVIGEGDTLEIVNFVGGG